MGVLAFLGFLIFIAQVVLSKATNTPLEFNDNIALIVTGIGLLILYETCRVMESEEKLNKHRIDYFIYNVIWGIAALVFSSEFTNGISNGFEEYSIVLCTVLVVAMSILDIFLIIRGVTITGSLQTSIVCLIDMQVRVIVWGFLLIFRAIWLVLRFIGWLIDEIL